MRNFFKGILIGIGGVSPGLSGSVMMLLFGLYDKCIEAIGTFFKDIKKNFIFLLPIALGMGIGILFFGKIVSFLLDKFPMYTRFTFFGLVLGTLPLFYKEVTKKGFHKKYYVVMGVCMIIGLLLFSNHALFEQTKRINTIQSLLLGVVIAASTIIPGVDSAVILSSLGLYEIYVNSVANLNLAVLIPALVGAGIGVFLFSILINQLIKKYYTITYSIIFGLFISIIPSVLDKNYNLGFNGDTFISLILLVIGFSVSFFMERLRKD